MLIILIVTMVIILVVILVILGRMININPTGHDPSSWDWAVRASSALSRRLIIIVALWLSSWFCDCHHDHEHYHHCHHHYDTTFIMIITILSSSALCINLLIIIQWNCYHDYHQSVIISFGQTSASLSLASSSVDVMKVGRVHWPVWADGFKRARFVWSSSV